MVPEGSPVYAVRGGTVARVVDWPHNCSQFGRCDQTCGVGVSINGDDGARYIYCHGTRLNGVDVGEIVAAGQLLMWSGNTGRSGAPHLHFEIRVAASSAARSRCSCTVRCWRGTVSEASQRLVASSDAISRASSRRDSAVSRDVLRIQPITDSEVVR